MKFEIKELINKVVKSGACCGCGACVAIDKSQKSSMFVGGNGPFPEFHRETSFIYNIKEICPGYGVHYPELYKSHFEKLPDNWLIGHYEHVRIGYSSNPHIRKNSASGGILTSVLIYLIEEEKVDYVVLAKQGVPTPLEARYQIVNEVSEILDCAQSIYIPVSILDSIKEFKPNKKYVMVCLPDQAAALRKMQSLGDERANQVKYIIGPYVGTSLEPDAIKAFIRSKGIRRDDSVLNLKWRAGEWPGYLEINTKLGKKIRSKKVYYNYLIPFFVTNSSLQSMDFTNEFSDLAVGDAWSPKLEASGGGHSVIVTRSREMENIIQQLSHKEKITVESIEPLLATDMHGHMLDFKKRGSYLRNKWKRMLGMHAPENGYEPEKITLSRKFVEIIIAIIFLASRNTLSRFLISYVPEYIIGPIFNRTRLTWKAISRPTKRKGLSNLKVIVKNTTNG